jgi:predicted aspartyl protease
MNPNLRKLFGIFLLSLILSASLTAQQVIKLQRFHKALWIVNITMKGKTGDFLFDTGGGVTLVSKKFAEGMDCRFWGRNTGYNMFGKRGDGPHCDDVALSAGKVALTRVNIGTIDFSEIFEDGDKLSGLLSLDAFDGKAITIDQKAATLTIETDQSLKRRVRSMKEFALRVARECSARCLSAFLGVKTANGMTWLNIDTGAGGVSLISNDHAEIFGLDPNKKEQTIKFPIGGGVTFGGAVMLADMIMDGNLGQPFLSRYVITIDLKNSRIWFAELA